jgi:polyferredoxin
MRVFRISEQWPGQMMGQKTLSVRILGGLLGISALAQPVCAAICPRGKGECPYPGKCFLYVDGDHNSLCDYTLRAVAPAPQTPAPIVHTTTITPAANAVPVVQTPTIVPVIPVVPSPPLTPATPGIIEFLQTHPLLIGIILFILLTALFLWVFRQDIGGIRFHTITGRLAFFALLSLGIAGILVCLLMGEAASGTVFALVYMIAGTVLAAYLWNTGNISRNSARAVLIVSSITGFVFLAPLMPIEFTGIIHLVLGLSAFTPGILGILFVLAGSVVVGRVFCAHICPVGSVQELAYLLPISKKTISRTGLLEIVRAVIFVATVAAGIYYINIMEYTGIYDLFSLTLTAGFFLFAAILAVSALVYRPVCRVLCPFGVLFSLLGHISRNGIVRSTACINCKKCERACPAHCAERNASKRECYLCGRCTSTCPVPEALAYGKR